MMRKWHGIVLIVMATLAWTFGQAGVAAAVNGGGASSFKDVSAKHWAKAQIGLAVGKGYVSGFPDGTFQPDKPVTVAEFLAMMFLSFTEVKEDGKRGWSDTLIDRVPELVRFHFTDYGFEFGQGNPWYINHVQNAKYFGAINDWEYEGRYDEPLTRERAAKIVNVMAGWLDGPVHEEHAKLAAIKLKDYSTFAPGWDVEAGESMIRGLVAGYPNGRYEPKRSITRAEAISVVERISDPGLRKPVKVDLSGVPYSMVVGGYGYPEYVHIFSNFEMKRVYDQLKVDLKYAAGEIEQNGTAMYYFKNVDTKNEGIHYRQHPELWYQNRIFIDMIIGCASNTYNLQISSIEDRFERRSDVLLRFLKSIFKEKGDEVYQLMEESLKELRNNSLKQVDLLIENRQVLIFSSPTGTDILDVAISGYADK